MNRALLCKWILCGLCCIHFNAIADSDIKDEPVWQSLYQQNFEQIEQGGLPDDFFVLEGNFYVTTKDGRKCLALAPYPVNEHGFLFGPRINNETVELSFPEVLKKEDIRFEGAVGGIRGIKFRFNPATHEVLISYRDDWTQTFPMSWSSKEWMKVVFSSERKLDKEQTNLKIKISKESDPGASFLYQDLLFEERVPGGKMCFWGFSMRKWKCIGMMCKYASKNKIICGTRFSDKDTLAIRIFRSIKFLKFAHARP